MAKKRKKKRGPKKSGLVARTWADAFYACVDMRAMLRAKGVTAVVREDVTRALDSLQPLVAMLSYAKGEK